MNKDNVFFITDFESTGVDTDLDYPIEIGIIVCDARFNIMNTYESLIKWPLLYDEVISAKKEWPEEYQVAYTYHKIPAKEWVGNSVNFEQVVREIKLLINKHQKGDRKPVIVSDNAVFETNFMKKMFDADKQDWPFHYCSHDTSLLLETTPIGDPRGVTHRALDDAAGLYRYIIRALEYNGYWK